MSRNHPDKIEDPLLVSAIKTLTEPARVYTTQDWRITMAKAQATEKKAALKTAEKAAAAKGITKPKHKPRVVAEQQCETTSTEGVDTAPDTMVKSGFSVFNQPQKESIVEQVATIKPQTQEEREAAAAAKIAAKEAKNAAAAAAKAEREAAAAAKKAEREAKNAETQAQREARVAELQAAGRTYTGSMTVLADRVKQGLYVKSATGQLRSTDDLAVALDAVPAENVVKLGVMLFEEVNKYANLNIGQQSMNYRNRMRGAIKKGTFTLERVTELVTEHGFATALGQAEAKAAKEAEKAAAKAAKEAEKAAVKAEKEAKAKAAAEAKAAKAAAPAAEPDTTVDALSAV